MNARIVRLALFVAGAGLACAAYACKPVAKEQVQVPPELPPTVAVERVVAGPIAESFEVTGAVQPLEQAEIVPSMAGRVAKALLSEGDAVKRGEILFRLERGSIRTVAGVAPRRTARKDREIRSPLVGVVLAQYAKPGDMVNATPPTVMALVADIDVLKMTALLSGERLAEARPGQEVTVTADALPGRGFGGRVTLVGPVADAGAESNQVEIIVENRDHALKPGMLARARVFTNYKSLAILVPPAALIAGRVRVAAGGVARVRPVRTGIRTVELVEVLDGVLPGDLVVVSGNNNLKDGARINYLTP